MLKCKPPCSCSIKSANRCGQDHMGPCAARSRAHGCKLVGAHWLTYAAAGANARATSPPDHTVPHVLNSGNSRHLPVKSLTPVHMSMHMSAAAYMRQHVLAADRLNHSVTKSANVEVCRRGVILCECSNKPSGLYITTHAPSSPPPPYHHQLTKGHCTGEPPGGSTLLSSVGVLNQGCSQHHQCRAHHPDPHHWQDQ
jgi:hypothetical protein